MRAALQLPAGQLHGQLNPHTRVTRFEDLGGGERVRINVPSACPRCALQFCAPSADTRDVATHWVAADEDVILARIVAERMGVLALVRADSRQRDDDAGVSTAVLELHPLRDEDVVIPPLCAIHGNASCCVSCACKLSLVRVNGCEYVGNVPDRTRPRPVDQREDS